MSNLAILAQEVREEEITEMLSSFEIKPILKHTIHHTLSKEVQKGDSCETELEETNDTEGSQNGNDLGNTVDREYLVEQEYWEDIDIQPSASINNSKQKHINSTQRMKLKEYNIKANDKAIARPPTYYKFDKSTTHILQMLIDQQHSGDFHNIVSKGTNSVVIHAHCYGKYHLYFPCGNALKVYRLGNNVEKNNAIYKRVQKENQILLTLRDQHFSNNAPHPVHITKNVILMSFIGSDQETAPSISTLHHEKLNAIYEEVIQEMDTWYKKLGLIHGSLSASKILYWTDKLYVIGWSHSVKKDQTMALKRLMKDCQFVNTFFQSKGVPVKSAEELFKGITGLDKISSKVLEVVHKDLWKDPRVANPNKTVVSNSKQTRNRFK